jgi:hypothetical protein
MEQKRLTFWKTLPMMGLCLMLGFTGAQVKAQEPNEANYDESKVPQFTLPEVLKCNNGQEIMTAEQWEGIRRPELMTIFTEQMFGKMPTDKVDVAYKKLDDNHSAIGGSATRKQIEMTFTHNGVTHKALLLMYLPNQIKVPVAVFFGCNFKGNQSISDDPDIIASNNSDAARGAAKSRWPISKIIDAGYGVATVWYYDFYPDQKDGQSGSILTLFGKNNANELAPDEGQAIAAWSWGVSRVMDYFETDNQIDAKKIMLLGHSRLGKTALWAGAQDQRFAIVISNESGCGGAALSKRAFGETVNRINNAFPHWFCKNFRKYNNNESALPFDQHELIALIAPRPVYVASALGDQWSDPKGEFLGAYFAGPVYKLYGFKGLESDVMPAIEKPEQNRVAYHIRNGKHDVTDFDWDNYIKFADKWLK